MLRSLRSRRPGLSYANVTATVALFIALGGSAYAVGRNEVGPLELDRNAVQKRHVDRNAIGAREILRRGVRAQNIGTGAVRPHRHIPDGSLTGQKIDESTLGLVPSARSAITADSATRAQSAASAADAGRLGGIAAAQYQRRIFAVIDGESGNLLRGANAVSAERIGDSNRYRVRFNRDVSACATIASARVPEDAERAITVNTVEPAEVDDLPNSLELLVSFPFAGTTLHLEVIC